MNIDRKTVSMWVSFMLAYEHALEDTMGAHEVSISEDELWALMHQCIKDGILEVEDCGGVAHYVAYKNEFFEMKEEL